MFSVFIRSWFSYVIINKTAIEALIYNFQIENKTLNHCQDSDYVIAAKILHTRKPPRGIKLFEDGTILMHALCRSPRYNGRSIFKFHIS